jgi:glucose dehydrogenase
MNRLTALLGVAVLAVVAYMALGPQSGQDAASGSGQAATSSVAPTTAFIDDERIKNAENEPGNWLAFGRTYEEQRHSPLTQINKETVSQLGLAWYKDMNTNRALEATPIVVDDTMYFTSTWSRVYAVDARTGETKWMYDPEVPGEWARKACCDVVNRGVAVYKGRVYVGTVGRTIGSLGCRYRLRRMGC